MSASSRAVLSPPSVGTANTAPPKCRQRGAARHGSSRRRPRPRECARARATFGAAVSPPACSVRAADAGKIEQRRFAAGHEVPEPGGALPVRYDVNARLRSSADQAGIAVHRGIERQPRRDGGVEVDAPTNPRCRYRYRRAAPRRGGHSARARPAGSAPGRRQSAAGYRPYRSRRDRAGCLRPAETRASHCRMRRTRRLTPDRQSPPGCPAVRAAPRRTAAPSGCVPCRNSRYPGATTRRGEGASDSFDPGAVERRRGTRPAAGRLR